MKLTTLLFLISGITMAIIHGIALELSLYWVYQPLDIPMHFLGGAVSALLVFTLRDLGIPGASYVASSLTRTMIFVILVMLSWEGFEVVFDIMVEGNYLTDTVIDLVMGFLGGMVGYLVASRIQMI
ncbi:hypothetical protein KC723_00395 [Candidatus Kaiserbacteria bacterium]|nr:hypothetical protein [Candidatus Kaiserbacteria bacterium]